MTCMRNLSFPAGRINFLSWCNLSARSPGHGGDRGDISMDSGHHCILFRPKRTNPLLGGNWHCQSWRLSLTIHRHFNVNNDSMCQKRSSYIIVAMVNWTPEHPCLGRMAHMVSVSHCHHVSLLPRAIFQSFLKQLQHLSLSTLHSASWPTTFHTSTHKPVRSNDLETTHLGARGVQKIM